MSDAHEPEVKPAEPTATQDFTGVAEQSKSPEAGARHEVSGTAIARMMGVATSSELRLLEGKLDLLSGRLSNLSVRVDKIISQFSSLPSGSDLERIDVQIGSLKALIRDLAVVVSSGESKPSAKAGVVKAQETQIIEEAAETK